MRRRASRPRLETESVIVVVPPQCEARRTYLEE